MFWSVSSTYGLEWCVYCRKGRVKVYECSDSKSINLLCVVGKLYGRVPIKRVMGVIECTIGEEQCSFKKGTVCMEQVCVPQMSDAVGDRWITASRDTSDTHSEINQRAIDEFTLKNYYYLV